MSFSHATAHEAVARQPEGRGCAYREVSQVSQLSIPLFLLRAACCQAALTIARMIEWCIRL